MTYYGYKRGDNTKIVDWASVSSKLTTDLGEIEKGRADERQKIEGEIAAANESINEMPVGNHESINNFVLGAANLAAERLRVQSTLMKNGQLKPSQFASFRQNVMDGVGGYKKVATTYNKIMDELVARQETREGGLLEAKEAELMQKLANLSNTVVVIDERTGTVMNALKLPNGEPDMNNAMPVRDMENLSLKKHDRFDIDKNLDPIVAKYGKEVRVINKLGVKTKESIAARQDFDKAVDLTIGSYNPFQLASVLFDYEQTHTPTENEAERNTNPDKFVLVKKDGNQSNKLTPVLTKPQEDQAKAAIKQQLLMKLDYVETPMADKNPTTRTSEDRVRARNIETAKADVNRLLEMFSGGADKKRQVLATYSDILNQKGNGFIEAKIEGDNMIITREVLDKNSGKMVETKESVPMPSDPVEFIKTVGPKLTGDQNLLDLMDEAIAGIDMTSVSKGTGNTSYKIEKEKDVSQKLVDWADIAGTISMPDSWYFTKSGKYGDVEGMVSDYIDGSGIKGASSKIDGDNLVISVDGIGDVSVDLDGKSSKEIETAVKGQLRVIHDAVISGKAISGSADPLGLGI